MLSTLILYYVIGSLAFLVNLQQEENLPLNSMAIFFACTLGWTAAPIWLLCVGLRTMGLIE
jgi:hypothetical protein